MATQDQARNLYLGVLIFRDVHADAWVAQGVEYDISAHGPTIQDAQVAFERVVAGYLRLDEQRHRAPFSTLRAAPQHFQAVWQRVAKKQTHELHANRVPAYVIQAISEETPSTNA